MEGLFRPRGLNGSLVELLERTSRYPVAFRFAWLVNPGLCGFDLRDLLQAQGFDGLLTQHKLLHLATGCQRIALDELEVPRDFLVADLALAVLAQLLLGQLLTDPCHHHGEQFLAKVGIRDTHDLHLAKTSFRWRSRSSD